MNRSIAWVKAQPDRPFVILLSHAIVILLYLTHHAVSPVPFRGVTTQTLVTSPILPIIHVVAAVALIIGMWSPRSRGTVAAVSLFTWCFTTGTLYFAATNRTPPLALWASGLALVITFATLLMLVRWGVDGDEREGR